MADFQELIKNFERIRDYIRQFFIYGFKARNEFNNKSLRTYDNERRRIECFLGNFVRQEYSSLGKHVSIVVDSKAILQNPLYAAWKSKSFTDKDLMLHFFLIDLLLPGTALTARELADKIAVLYGQVFDSQTIRLKLKEYELCGILSSIRKDKSVCYSLIPPMAFETADMGRKVLNAVCFFQEASPFGFVGSTILDRDRITNDIFYFKHHFIVHTLEDGVLYQALCAMRNHCGIAFRNKSPRSGLITHMTGVPLKIFVSTQTGRRYLCIFVERGRRFLNVRLDSIADVSMLPYEPDYDKLYDNLTKNVKKCWGVSFDGINRIEELFLKLHIDETKEAHVLSRLHREGRSGEVLRISADTFLYSGAFFDTNEMLPWIKTFIGRILDVQGSNQAAVRKLYGDMERLYEMYFTDEIEADS